VRPDHYDLAFVVDLARARFEGTETIRVRLDRQATRIVLHAADIEFRAASVRQGGASQTATVTLDAKTETAALAVPGRLAAGPAEIDIRYTEVLNGQLRGFYLSKDRRPGYAVTQLRRPTRGVHFPSFGEPALRRRSPSA
jgi:aminopeptidase N